MALNYRTLWLNDETAESPRNLQDFINHGFTPPLYGVIEHTDKGEIAMGLTYVDPQKRLKQWLPEDVPAVTIVNNHAQQNVLVAESSKPLAENDEWLFFIRQ